MENLLADWINSQLGELPACLKRERAIAKSIHTVSGDLHQGIERDGLLAITDMHPLETCGPHPIAPDRSVVQAGSLFV
jgi:hypothetical protein